jgi:2-(1,2-epoxy-1,2-dihydrophenyl)acetyl-CoA isomerase
MAYSQIKYAREEGLAIVTMADPATLNAITPAMVMEMTAAFGDAAREARCVVLTGEGRGFSSGANLTGGPLPVDAEGRIDVGGRLDQYHPFVALLRDLPIPFITAVNGPAAGIGCSFALMGDLIIAAESAYFLQAFRRIGLIPDGGSTYLLPRMLTRARAMELMLLGEKLPAAKALEWGLINRCVPDAELMNTTHALAGALAGGPTRALGMTRRLAWASLDADLTGQLAAERAAQRQAGLTADFAEGVSAFAQKRPPKFNGT